MEDPVSCQKKKNYQFLWLFLMAKIQKKANYLTFNQIEAIELK